MYNLKSIAPHGEIKPFNFTEHCFRIESLACELRCANVLIENFTYPILFSEFNAKSMANLLTLNTVILLSQDFGNMIQST